MTISTTSPTWIDKINPNSPQVIQHLNDRFGIIKNNNPLLFPDLSKADSIFSFSDYSNDDNKDAYQVITYFIINGSDTSYFNMLRDNFRCFDFDYTRQFQFKKLNKDRERIRLLEKYLEIFDGLTGLVLTILVHKDIKYLFIKSPHEILKNSGVGQWKPHIAEKVLRVLHFQAFLIYGLSRPNQKYLWMTDRDAITKDMNILGEILGRIFDIYAPFGFSPLGYAEPLGDLRLPFLDYLSIPDLVGGSMLELLRNQNGHHDPNLENNTMVQEKSMKILRWAASQNSKLKKLGCRIYGTDENIEVSLFTLNKAGK